jgi:hypothetical protein
MEGAHKDPAPNKLGTGSCIAIQGSSLSLSLGDVYRLFSLRTIGDFEFHRLAFCETLESITLDCGIVDEYVLSALRRNEPVSLLIVKPFNYACCHYSYFPFLKIMTKSGVKIKAVGLSICPAAALLLCYLT